MARKKQRLHLDQFQPSKIAKAYLELQKDGGMFHMISEYRPCRVCSKPALKANHKKVVFGRTLQGWWCPAHGWTFAK